MGQRRRLSEEERECRRAQDRAQLRQAAEQLLSTAGWQRWVRARASHGLARYSLFRVADVASAQVVAVSFDDMSSTRLSGLPLRLGER